ncbi:hypothetical protein I4U23_015583 [Adineta vaga]|nr:hypothetical protein I4U23_015583 [Adineta vaga]
MLTCYKQIVLIVYNKKIDEWSTPNHKWHIDTLPRNSWCPPISCQPHDQIKCIRINEFHIAVIIEKFISSQKTTGLFYFKLRNRGMSTLRRIETDYEHFPDTTRLFNLPNHSGWLFFSRIPYKEYCYVLDNNMQRYDQKWILSSNITDITVQNNLILLRKKDSDTSDVLEIYQYPK